jgi:hypothetical protein
VCSRKGSHAATVSPSGTAVSHGHGHEEHHFDQREAYPTIGKREIVGYGINGNPSYFDMPDYPCPGIRWKEETPEITALKQKELGDWKNLSAEEKKACMDSGQSRIFSSRQSCSSVRVYFLSVPRKLSPDVC